MVFWLMSPSGILLMSTPIADNYRRKGDGGGGGKGEGEGEGEGDEEGEGEGGKEKEKGKEKGDGGEEGKGDGHVDETACGGTISVLDPYLRLKLFLSLSLSLLSLSPFSLPPPSLPFPFSSLTCALNISASVMRPTKLASAPVVFALAYSTFTASSLLSPPMPPAMSLED
jgi:hypothetical protein